MSVSLHTQLSALSNYSHLQTTDRENEGINLSRPVSGVNGAQIPYRFKTLKLPACSEQKCFHYLPMNHYLWRGGEKKPKQYGII